VTRAGTAAACAAILSIAAPVSAQSATSVDALASWVNAVKAHTPGKSDAPVGFIAALKYSDRVILNPAMTLFLTAVRGGSIATKSTEQQRIVDLYRAVRSHPGLAVFLERAAVLHADAAIFRDKFPDFVDDAPTPLATTSSIDTAGAPSVRRSAPPSPLLSNEVAVKHADGRVLGEAPLNWNWPFARSLLDLLLTPRRGQAAGMQPSDIATAADLAFVAEWYHATDAYMMATGQHAGLNRQLGHAAAVLPEDAHILFDRACYAETLGLPLYQVLPGDPGFFNASRRTYLEVPAEDRTDADAESLFRHAIDVDPQYAEARVRLARLLEHRGLRDEAAAQVERALAARPTDAVAYFAHLVAGRVELARGRARDSFGQYRAALAIFPDAQSALVGASQAAVMASDVSTALSLVGQLGDRSGQFDADPWWAYHLGAGRDVDELMAAVWSHVPQ
jgi:tetratricopeptide (TPR) repeat protein